MTIILRNLLVLFLCALLGVWQASAAGVLLLGGPAAAAFTGPGDVVSGATGWWGLRAYNAAYATGSNSAAIVCDSATFTTCSTINILADGNFDKATASGSAACATACVVKSLTDQTGNGNTMTCSSTATCPVLTFNCLNTTLPCLTFSGAANQFLTTPSSLVISSNFTMVAEAERTGNFSSFGGIIGSDSNVEFIVFGSSANTVLAGGGAGTLSVTAADLTLHSLISVSNGASGFVDVDNAITTGTLASGTTSPFRISGNNNLTLTGIFAEGGVWGSTVFTQSPQAANMCHNMRLYWGSGGAC